MRNAKVIAIAVMLFACHAALAQSDHLSQSEIDAAAKAKPHSGFAWIMDMGLSSDNCNAQYPSIYVYTPAGWLNALSISTHRQFLPFTPTTDDTLRALTIIAHGCAAGTAAGPVCDSITRVALLSDQKGGTVVEAVASHPVTESWQNGFGARTVCASIVSQFLLSDVQKVRDPKGEFFVGVFGNGGPLKIYKVKEKYVKDLGMK